MRLRRIASYMNWCFHLAAALSLLLAIYIAAVSFSARRQPKVIGVFANYRIDTTPKVRQQLNNEEWHAGTDPGEEFPIWACHFTGDSMVFAQYDIMVKHSMQTIPKTGDDGSTSGFQGSNEHYHFIETTSMIRTDSFRLETNFAACRIDVRACQVGSGSMRWMPADDIGSARYQAAIFPEWTWYGITREQTVYILNGGLRRGAVESLQLIPFGKFLRVPVWMNLTLFLYLPSAWLAQRVRAIVRHRLRIKRNLCTACGYDLRESPDACPECGAPSAPSRV